MRLIRGALVLGLAALGCAPGALAASITIDSGPSTGASILVGSRVRISATADDGGCKPDGSRFPRWLYEFPGGSTFYPSYGDGAFGSMTITDSLPTSQIGTYSWYAYFTCVSQQDSSLLTASSETRSYTVVSQLPTPTPTPSPTPTPKPKATPKPKTHCYTRHRRHRHRVLCAGVQRRFVNDLLRHAGKASALSRKLKYALRREKQAPPPRKKDWQDLVVDGAVAFQRLITGQWSQILPPAPKLPTVVITLPRAGGKWNDLFLPKSVREAKEKWEDSRFHKLYEFAKADQETLRYTDEYLQAADVYARSNPGAMDALVFTETGKDHWAQLTPAEKLQVASSAQGLTGATNKLINHMVDMGVAAEKVTNSLPGSF